MRQDGVVWIASDKLFRDDSRISGNHPTDFSTLIQQVIVNDRNPPREEKFGVQTPSENLGRGGTTISGFR